LAHDAFSIWVEAARRAGNVEVDALRSEFVKRDQPFETMTGPLVFADDHSARRPVYVSRVKNRELVFVAAHGPGPEK
jgi:hypothetical protein